MKLYYYPGACSLAPHIVLRDAGYRFELEKVDLETKRMERGGDFHKVNPKGQVPALLLDDGQVLTEVAVVVQWLADQMPESRLVPKFGTMERYRLMEWLTFISSELHKQFAPFWSPISRQAAKDVALVVLHKRFNYLSQILRDKPYLMGDQYTVADAYAYAVLGWCNFFRIDLARWPALTEYVARVGSRPTVRAALKAEGLIQ